MAVLYAAGPTSELVLIRVLHSRSGSEAEFETF